MRIGRRALLAGGIAALLYPPIRSPLAATADRRLFVGTYTTGRGPLGGNSSSQGLYSVAFDAATGELGEPQLAAAASDPTNLILHSNGRALYAAHGFGTRVDGMNPLTAYAIEGGTLRELNSVPSGGFTPTHGAVDRTGRALVLTNYRSDNVAVFRLRADGSLGARTALAGKSAGTMAWQDADTWEKPHIAVLSGKEQFVITAEINTDRCVVYRFDAGAGTLDHLGSAAVPSGAGPRHLAFHPSYRFLYSSDEHGSSVTALRWNEDTGELAAFQTISSLPADFTDSNQPSHIAVHPSGKFLYIANRGHGSLGVFAIDQDSGHLTAAGHAPLGAGISWCFVIDPTGTWLVAANMSDDHLVTFRIDPATGALEPLNRRVQVGTPTCIVMV